MLIIKPIKQVCSDNTAELLFYTVLQRKQKITKALKGFTPKSLSLFREEAGDQRVRGLDETKTPHGREELEEKPPVGMSHQQMEEVAGTKMRAGFNHWCQRGLQKKW